LFVPAKNSDPIGDPDLLRGEKGVEEEEGETGSSESYGIEKSGEGAWMSKS